MGFVKFLKDLFKQMNKNKKSKKSNMDKSFHPELLYLINKNDAEYVNFIE